MSDSCMVSTSEKPSLDNKIVSKNNNIPKFGWKTNFSSSTVLEYHYFMFFGLLPHYLDPPFELRIK
jgi:hypothetical protein